MMEGRSFDNKNDDDNHDTKMAEPWEVPPAPSPAPASTGKKHESKSKSYSSHNKKHSSKSSKDKSKYHSSKSKTKKYHASKSKSKKLHATGLVDTRDDHEIVEEDKKHLKETGVHHGENPTPPPAVGKDPVFYHGDELHKNASDVTELVDA